MVRLIGFWIVAVLTLLTSAPATAAPQRPSFLMLRDPARNPVDGAVGLLLPDPARELPALAELGSVETFFSHTPPMLGGSSRGTGALRLGGPNGEARAGAVLVLADGPGGTHLAGFVPRLLPGDADRLQLEHAGLVRGPDPDAEIILFAAALIDDRRIALPAMNGTLIPLPPGRYEAWVQRRQGPRIELTWQQLSIAAGETATVAFDGRTRALQCPDGATVTPAGRPDVVLVDADRESCTLRGLAVDAPLTAWRAATGRSITGTEIAFDDNETPLDIRPTFDGEPPPDDGEPVRGFVLSRSAFGSWRVHGAAVLDAAGSLRLPKITGGDDWLLVLAPGHAPFARPLPHVATEPAIAIPRGESLVVRCTLAGGDPAIDALLEYVPQNAEVATLAVRTDRRGHADFGRVTLPGTVRASDRRYQNAEQQIDAIAAHGARLTLGPGFEVRGTVTMLDGESAAGVTVTLTAPHDQLRPRERSTVTAADGLFAFGGLVENSEYVVFATTRRDGRTWSSKVGRFLAGSTPLVLTIQNEDPQLGPDRIRR